MSCKRDLINSSAGCFALKKGKDFSIAIFYAANILDYEPRGHIRKNYLGATGDELIATLRFDPLTHGTFSPTGVPKSYTKIVARLDGVETGAIEMPPRGLRFDRCSDVNFELESLEPGKSVWVYEIEAFKGNSVLPIILPSFLQVIPEV